MSVLLMNMLTCLVIKSLRGFSTLIEFMYICSVCLPGKGAILHDCSVGPPPLAPINIWVEQNATLHLCVPSCLSCEPGIDFANVGLVLTFGLVIFGPVRD